MESGKRSFNYCEPQAPSPAMIETEGAATCSAFFRAWISDLGDSARSPVTPKDGVNQMRFFLAGFLRACGMKVIFWLSCRPPRTLLVFLHAA